MTYYISVLPTEDEHYSLMPSCLRLYGILIPALKRDVFYPIVQTALSWLFVYSEKRPNRKKKSDSKHMQKFPKQFRYQFLANAPFFNFLCREQLNLSPLRAGAVN